VSKLILTNTHLSTRNDLVQQNMQAFRNQLSNLIESQATLKCINLEVLPPNITDKVDMAL